MNETEAATIKIGDAVMYDGHRAIVQSIRTSGTAGPYYRLIWEFGPGTNPGLVSHMLCRVVPDNTDAIERANAGHRALVELGVVAPYAPRATLTREQVQERIARLRGRA